MGTAPKGEKGQPQKAQAGQGLSLCDEGSSPEGGDGSLDGSFVRSFRGRGDHGLHWVWEGVLVAEAPDLGEPGVLDAVVEHIYPMLVKDV